ncbi:hypothetical protein AYI70_g5820 [Smittium culicis]|uniref:Selenoprotein S n=1 Tax=Smittium culicis TaxID=133412 RepID=A0A1R1XST7_9FUNG|nr:hypothetical protein AYI70_g5820 [Smittium culicis]
MFSLFSEELTIKDILSHPREYAFPVLVILSLFYLIVTKLVEAKQKSSLEKGKKKFLLDEQRRQNYLKRQQELLQTSRSNNSSDSGSIQTNREKLAEEKEQKEKEEKANSCSFTPRRPALYTSNFGRSNIRGMNDINRKF